MKLVRFALVLVASAVLQGSAGDLPGKWTARFTGPIGPRPKMFSEVVLNLAVKGSQLTGNAHMGNWPGDAPLSDGKVDGDRFSFTVTGLSPWRSRDADGVERMGYPTMRFEGTVKGKLMDLTMTWNENKLPMEGTKEE